MIETLVGGVTMRALNKDSMVGTNRNTLTIENLASGQKVPKSKRPSKPVSRVLYSDESER